MSYVYIINELAYDPIVRTVITSVGSMTVNLTRLA